MDQALLERALKPGHSSMVLVHQMTGAAREEVVGVLASAVVRAAALELAEALEAELQKAREAAAEPAKRVEAARQAIADEQGSIATRLADFWRAARRSEPDDREREPERETPKLQELRAALAEAERDAFPSVQAVRILEEQVQGLRAAPEPDPTTLAVLTDALLAPLGARHEADR